MTIMQVLMAILADGVMEAIASTRRTYLAEIGRYFDQRGLTARSRPGRMSD